MATETPLDSTFVPTHPDVANYKKGATIDTTYIPVKPESLADTIASQGGQRESLKTTRSLARSAVLPKSTISGVVANPSAPESATANVNSERYSAVKALGEGGMGEVVLVKDHDIDREVAVKRLHPTMVNQEIVGRFAEEIRIVGQLEHPNIIPIHDVGTDEAGQHYFTMKFIQGETLEGIIEKLKAHNPEYLAKYTHAFRLRIFQQVLYAIQFAHSRGIIHRDLKPANIMVSNFGSVTVMDWGLAKRIRADDGAKIAPVAIPLANMHLARGLAMDAKRELARSSGTPEACAIAEVAATRAAVPAPAPPVDGQSLGRLVKTEYGALMGTPMYMSPEQARGENDTLDERSDIFSLNLILTELMTLKHPLAEKQTLKDVLDGIMAFNTDHLWPLWLASGSPQEFVHIARKGLSLKPEGRFQSMDEFVSVFERTMSGEIAVQCPFTLSKRITYEAVRLMETYPKVYLGVFSMVALGTVSGLGYGLYSVARHLLG